MRKIVFSFCFLMTAEAFAIQNISSSGTTPVLPVNPNPVADPGTQVLSVNNSVGSLNSGTKSLSHTSGASAQQTAGSLNSGTVVLSSPTTDLNSYKQHLLGLSNQELWNKAITNQVGTCSIGDATNGNCPTCVCNYYSRYKNSAGNYQGLPMDTGCLEIPEERNATKPGTPTASELLSGVQRIRDALNAPGDKCGLQPVIAQVSVSSVSGGLKEMVQKGYILFTDIKKDKVSCTVKGLYPKVDLGGGQLVEPYLEKKSSFCTHALGVYRSMFKADPVIRNKADFALNTMLTSTAPAAVGWAISRAYFSTYNVSLLSNTQANQLTFSLMSAAASNNTSLYNSSLATFQTLQQAAATSPVISGSPVTFGQALMQVNGRAPASASSMLQSP